ncbi:DUF829 domain containing protein [Pyrenophora tritici-repentis]|nr:DUF829 domain containing protein [Pyrenophora tritici-repentis]
MPPSFQSKMLAFVLTIVKRFVRFERFEALANNATAKVKNPHDSIPGCRSIAPTIWERIRPSTSNLSEDNSAPCLIILMTWTGAYGQHISKYVSEYATMFPTSHILVITTSAKDIVWRSSAQKRERLLPAIKYILSLYGIPQSCKGGILLHIFSEGGANKACELAIAYRSVTGSQLPISAMCMDSTPGHPRFLRLCSALAKSFPPIPVLKQFATVIAVVMLGLAWAVYHVFKGYENNPVSRSRRQLLDPELFALTVPRCYLYSKGDALVAWQDIYEHASELISRNGCVTETIFEDSEHVTHAKRESRRYWNTVRTVWVHSQGEHEKIGTKPTSRNPKLPEPVFKDGVITADIPVVEESPAKTDNKQESVRYSAFV